jgi:hypothetical protein
MSWQCVDTIPIRVAANVTPARADAIRTALLRRAVPLARMAEGRLEPLATAALISDGRRTGLLTAGHVFETASTGDLAIPLPSEGAIASMRSARVRVVVHAVSDLALIWIDDPSLVRRLRGSWEPCPLPLRPLLEPDATTYVVAGYPTANARRVEGWVYAKPMVLFTTALDHARFAYARTAERVDGLTIHTPELDGVSGATVWGVNDEGEDGVSCVLRPAAVQVAFLHARHLRAEPISKVIDLLLPG